MEIPPLTKEQQQLVSDNLRLAYYYTGKVIKSGYLSSEYREEIESACILSLCKAATLWNKSIAKFSTYAVGGMKLGVRNLRHEIIQRNRVKTVSEDATMHEDRLSLFDLRPAATNDQRYVDCRDEIDSLKRFVSERDWQVIQKIHLEGKTRKEVSREMKISHERIRQILARGIHSMRHQRTVFQRESLRMGKKARNLKGIRVNMLVAVKPTDKRVERNRSIVWLCRCDCGNDCYIPSDAMNPHYGWSAYSCGCTENPNRKGKKRGKKQTCSQTCR